VWQRARTRSQRGVLYTLMHCYFLVSTRRSHLWRIIWLLWRRGRRRLLCTTAAAPAVVAKPDLDAAEEENALWIFFRFEDRVEDLVQERIYPNTGHISATIKAIGYHPCSHTTFQNLCRRAARVISTRRVKYKTLFDLSAKVRGLGFCCGVVFAVSLLMVAVTLCFFPCSWLLCCLIISFFVGFLLQRVVVFSSSRPLMPSAPSSARRVLNSTTLARPPTADYHGRRLPWHARRRRRGPPPPRGCG
jgi:hypothetical protein